MTRRSCGTRIRRRTNELVQHGNGRPSADLALVGSQVQSRGLQEMRDMISLTQDLVRRAWQGAPGSREELQRLVAHHDFAETMQAFEQYPNGPPQYSDPAGQRLWAGLRSVYTQAQQLAQSTAAPAATRPPASNNTPLYVGAGVGLVAVLDVAYMVLR